MTHTTETKQRMRRVIIYPKDIMILTGKSERNARALHGRIREHFGKQRHQVLMVSEFCEYMGMNVEEVRKMVW